MNYHWRPQEGHWSQKHSLGCSMLNENIVMTFFYLTVTELVKREILFFVLFREESLTFIRPEGKKAPMTRTYKNSTYHHFKLWRDKEWFTFKYYKHKEDKERRNKWKKKKIWVSRHWTTPWTEQVTQKASFWKKKIQR